MAMETAQRNRFQPNGIPVNTNLEIQKRNVEKRKAEKWAEIWFTKLCQFHKQPRDAQWQFTAEHVISFLQAKVKEGFPVWKRLKIVENLISFQRKAQVAQPADLRFIAVT